MNINNTDWMDCLKDEIDQPYFKRLINFLEDEYQSKTIYPIKEDLFNALKYTSYQDTKVLILGQDPYHQKNQAMGLAFSVKPGIQLPPSLRNILKELKDDLGIELENGDLSHWAKQGVFMMNAIWSVEEGKPLSHKDQGWERFSDKIIQCLNQKQTPVVFVLWGKYAQEKAKMINNPLHLIITNVHPSPLSSYRGFFGSKPFSQINTFLEKNHLPPIAFDRKELS